MDKRRSSEVVNYDQKITGIVIGVGKRHLEVQIPHESRMGYCHLSDTTDFIKGSFQHFFHVGEQLTFVLSKKHASNSKVFLNYKGLHPEEMKYKSKPISTASYNVNLNHNLKEMIRHYQFGCANRHTSARRS